MKISELCSLAHALAHANGFKDSEANVAMRLALIHSEVSEALEADRLDQPKYWITEDGKPEGLAAELADVVIRVCHLASVEDLDLERAILDKLEYNKTRPYKHSRRY